MLELLSKIILIPIVLVILLVMVYVLSLLISAMWRIVIICSSGGWALFALPAGLLLILASIDTVNTGLILVVSSFIAGLIFAYFHDCFEEPEGLGGFWFIAFANTTILWLTYTSYGIGSIPFLCAIIIAWLTSIGDWLYSMA